MVFEQRNSLSGVGNPAPVKEGDILDVTIEAVGDKGDGIAKKEGFVIFVPGTRTGDHVKIKVTKVFPKVSIAEVVHDDEPESAGEVTDSETFGEE